MERKWTREQYNAIYDRGRTLLISAGAGAGKTSVLTERIMQKIMDKDYNCNITDFLIVSYNKASAADLKKKITSAIREYMTKADPEMTSHLRRQLILVHQAQISTMHAFCLNIVRSNADVLGIPYRFKIAADSERVIMKRMILENTLNYFYDNGDENFYNTIENFIIRKNDKNSLDVLLRIYEKCESAKDKYGWIKNQKAELEQITGLTGDDTGFSDTIYGKRVSDYIKYYSDYFFDNSESIKNIVNASGTLQKKFGSFFEVFFLFLYDLKKPNLSYNTMKSLIESVKLPRIGPQKIEDEISSTILNKYKDRAKDAVKEIQSLFTYSFEYLVKFASDYGKHTEMLLTILEKFDSALYEEKNRLRLYEFSDLERFAYNLLSDATIAQRVRNDYAEVYIDEYQDTNEIQDAIFKSISTEDDNCNGGNRFMVGDVKQSIYAYRGANSAIFTSYNNRFGDYGNAGDTMPARIFLSQNFRSDECIIDFVNAVFTNVFALSGRGISYTDKEKLIFGKKGDTSKQKVELILIEQQDGGESKISAETEYTAQLVKSILREGKLNNGEPVEPRHIAVLIRSKGNNEELSRAFEKHGIPCFSDKTEDFFDSAENLLFFSLLHTINNPYREIYLTAVLKSPVFNFTLDDLIKIKQYADILGYKKASLYKCLQYYRDGTAEYSGEAEPNPLTDPQIAVKIERFFMKLNKWREDSVKIPAYKLIWQLMEEIDIFSILAREDNIIQRKANLLLFYEYAKNYEMSAYKGLYDFLIYLEELISNKNSLTKITVNPKTGDGINIMSIHKSKGLEFPICILVNNAAGYNYSDCRNDPLMNEKSGIYYKLKAEDTFGRYNTPMRKMVAHQNELELYNEESRILYVALTRAMEKLYITGTVKKIRKYLQETIEYEEASNTLSVFSASSNLNRICGSVLASDYTDFLEIKEIYASNRDISHAEADLCACSCKHGGEDEHDGHIHESAASNTITNAEIVEEYTEKIKKMYEFEYIYSNLSKLPMKLSVSGLHPGVLDDDEYRVKYENAEFMPLPRFIGEDRVNPAEIGNAMHIFMQFADFNNIDLYGIEYEAERMLDNGFITNKHYKLLEYRKLKCFFEGELYKRIKKSDFIRREMRFNLRIPASAFSMDEERKKILVNEFILVQGVIDLMYKDENGRIVVVDFKTDRVKRTDGHDTLKARYKNQLEYYSIAAEEITGKVVSATYIYSFSLGEEIRI